MFVRCANASDAVCRRALTRDAIGGMCICIRPMYGTADLLGKQRNSCRLTWTPLCCLRRDRHRGRRAHAMHMCPVHMFTVCDYCAAIRRAMWTPRCCSAEAAVEAAVHCQSRCAHCTSNMLTSPTALLVYCRAMWTPRCSSAARPPSRLPCAHPLHLRPLQ